MNTDDLTESISVTDETGALIMNDDKPEITLKADVTIDEKTYQHIRCHLDVLRLFEEDGSFMDHVRASIAARENNRCRSHQVLHGVYR